MFWCFFGRRFMKHGSWKGWKGGITAIWSPGATTLNPFRRREISRTLWPSMAWGMWFASKKPNKNINKGLGSTQKWIRDRHRFVPKVCVLKTQKIIIRFALKQNAISHVLHIFTPKSQWFIIFPQISPWKASPLGPNNWDLRAVQERSAALQPSDAWIVANRMDQLPEFFCKAQHLSLMHWIWVNYNDLTVLPHWNLG